MIAFIAPMAAGNAVRIILSPPAEAAAWQVLRATTDTLSGPDQAGAVVAADWGRYEAVIDTDGLVNGTEVFYRVFYRRADGTPILPHHPSRAATPECTAHDASAAPLRFLRERLDLGLKAAVAQQRLRPTSGRIEVRLSPFVDPNKLSLPVVSVHLESDQPSDRMVGDYIAEAMGLDETTGWLSQVTIQILGTSLNPDERITLGEVMKHIVLANLEILEANGLIKPAISISHTELVPEANAAPLYVAVGTFTCLAPSTTEAANPPITDAETTLLETAP